MQCDQGSEFKGEVKTFVEMLGIKLINSRPRHKSQGKSERSHGTWKRKLRFDYLDDTIRGEMLYFHT